MINYRLTYTHIYGSTYSNGMQKTARCIWCEKKFPTFRKLNNHSPCPLTEVMTEKEEDYRLMRLEGLIQ